jgi:hypothetical protein
MRVAAHSIFLSFSQYLVKCLSPQAFPPPRRSLFIMFIRSYRLHSHFIGLIEEAMKLPPILQHVESF